MATIYTIALLKSLSHLASCGYLSVTVVIFWCGLRPTSVWPLNTVPLPNEGARLLSAEERKSCEKDYTRAKAAGIAESLPRLGRSG